MLHFLLILSCISINVVALYMSSIIITHAVTFFQSLFVLISLTALWNWQFTTISQLFWENES